MNIQQLPNKGKYCAVWRRAITLAKLSPETRIAIHWGCYEPAKIIRQRFLHALNRRINSRGGMEGANEPIDIGLIRDAFRLKDIARRIRVYQFETKLCRERFSHLLSRYED